MLLASGWGLEKSLSMQGVAGFKTGRECQKEWKGYSVARWSSYPCHFQEGCSLSKIIVDGFANICVNTT